MIGPPLLHVLPVHVAGRCLLGGILLLNLAGGVLALHRALFGRRSFWPLASGLVAYNSSFLTGFLNWGIGSGLAMLFAAAWLTWRESRPAMTIADCDAGGGRAVLLSPDGPDVLPRTDRRRRERTPLGSARACAGPIGVAAAGAGGADGAGFLAAPQAPPAATHWMNPHEKLVQTASPFVNYLFALDMASAPLVYGGSRWASRPAGSWSRRAPSRLSRRWRSCTSHCRSI